MKINSFCLTCLIQMQESQVREFTDEEKKMQYMRSTRLSFLLQPGSLRSGTRPPAFPDLSEILGRAVGT